MVSIENTHLMTNIRWFMHLLGTCNKFINFEMQPRKVTHIKVCIRWQNNCVVVFMSSLSSFYVFKTVNFLLPILVFMISKIIMPACSDNVFQQIYLFMYKSEIYASNTILHQKLNMVQLFIDENYAIMNSYYESK